MLKTNQLTGKSACTSVSEKKNHTTITKSTKAIRGILSCRSIKTIPVEKKSWNSLSCTPHSKIWQLKTGNQKEFSSTERILSSIRAKYKPMLTEAAYAAATAMSDGNIYFSFADNSDTGNACAGDRVILYAEIKKDNRIVISSDAGSRSDCEAILDMTALKPCIAETYIAFSSECGTMYSKRIYTGRVYL